MYGAFLEINALDIDRNHWILKNDEAIEYCSLDAQRDQSGELVGFDIGNIPVEELDGKCPYSGIWAITESQWSPGFGEN